MKITQHNLQQRNNHISWIDAVKGVCILLVVMHHFTRLVYPSTLEGDNAGVYFLIAEKWVIFDRIFAPLRMPVFFFISGYLVRNYVNNLPFSASADKRVFKLLWTLAIWGFVQWLIVFNLNQIGIENVNAERVIDAIYAKSISEYLQLAVLGYSSLWYLYALALYFSVCHSFRHHKRILTGLILALYVVMHSSIQTIGWGPESLIHNSVFFLFGAFWGESILRFLERCDKTTLLYAIAAIVFTTVTYHLGFSARFIGSFVAVGIAFFTVHRAQKLLNSPWLTWISWLGRHTLAIYIFHRVAIEVLMLGLTLLGSIVAFGGGYLGLIWYAASPLVLPITISFLCAHVGMRLERRAPWLFSLPWRHKGRSQVVGG